MHRFLSRIPTGRRKIRAGIVLLVGLLVFLTTTAESCGGSSGKGQKSETGTQQSNYDKLVSQDPAHTMNTSPTRKVINRWIDRWGKDPNKLAYIYFQNSNGDLTGFYVFKGLPVSYCTSISPNYKVIVPEVAGDNNTALTVPAPSMDGVYYSGGECNRYYGFDASSDAYVDFTVGLGINLLMYDQPLTNHPNVPNLAPARK